MLEPLPFHSETRPLYLGFQASSQPVASAGSILSVRYSRLAYPQSQGIMYCLPLTWPFSTRNGLRFLKLGRRLVSHGWINPWATKLGSISLQGCLMSNGPLVA